MMPALPPDKCTVLQVDPVNRNAIGGSFGVPKTHSRDRSWRRQPSAHWLKRWLLGDFEIKGTEGPHTKHEVEHPFIFVYVMETELDPSLFSALQ
jgi:hypothetical protein